MKLCIDCIHFIPSNMMTQATYGKCGQNFFINPVDGSRTYDYAEYHRKSLSSCGPDAQFFEPAHDPRGQEGDDFDPPSILNPPF